MTCVSKTEKENGPVLATSGDATRLRVSVVTPLAPEHYKIQLSVSRETYDKLRRVQDLLRHTIPNGDPAAVFDRALTLLLAALEKTKLAATTQSHASRAPAPRSRHIPAAVRRAVWRPDAGQCAFVGSIGRCGERGFLEFHHIIPYANGGEATVENIALRCRSHNAYEAEKELGPLFVRERQETWRLGPYGTGMPFDIEGRFCMSRNRSDSGTLVDSVR